MYQLDAYIVTGVTGPVIADIFSGPGRAVGPLCKCIILVSGLLSN